MAAELTLITCIQKKLLYRSYFSVSFPVLTQESVAFLCAIRTPGSQEKRY